MSLSANIQELLSRLGLYVQLKPPKEIRRRLAALQHHEITTVLDVGANSGQYAGELRRYGFGGRIVSYEPLTDAFAALQAKAQSDDKWLVRQLALGSKPGNGEINVSQNSWSSSLRDLLSSHLEDAPDSAYIGKQAVTISTVDEQFAELDLSGEKIWLKIDTQGFEREVLAGSEKSLSSLQVVQLEISLTPLYAEGLLLEETLSFFANRGFELIGLEPGFYSKTSGHQLQVDGIFLRKA